MYLKDGSRLGGIRRKTWERLEPNKTLILYSNIVTVLEMSCANCDLDNLIKYCN